MAMAECYLALAVVFEILNTVSRLKRHATRMNMIYASYSYAGYFVEVYSMQYARRLSRINGRVVL